MPFVSQPCASATDDPNAGGDFAVGSADGEAASDGESREQIRVGRLGDEELGAHDRGGKAGSLVRVRVSSSGGEQFWWALRRLTHTGG